MKRLLIGFVFGVFFTLLLLWGYQRFGKESSVISPLNQTISKITEKALDKYTFDNLRKQQFKPSAITIGKVVKDDPKFTSRLFYFTVNGKKVSGLMNTPKISGTYPVIVMFRGFVPAENYTSGTGTLRSAEYIASNGFITLAPDFLGFGQSDPTSTDAFEDRFQTYTTALTLLSSVQNLNTPLARIDQGAIKADSSRVGIWGHSNGGNISLSVLSITGKPYPTVLWNPVSQIFPYTILYFTYEYDDHGKWLIQKTAEFEQQYDAEKYSPPNYYKYITAPIQLNQAVADEEVPIRWSDQLNQVLTKQGTNITYYTYPGENHNFNNGSWAIAIRRAVDFYKVELAK